MRRMVTIYHRYKDGERHSDILLRTKGRHYLSDAAVVRVEFVRFLNRGYFQSWWKVTVLNPPV